MRQSNDTEKLRTAQVIILAAERERRRERGGQSAQPVADFSTRIGEILERIRPSNSDIKAMAKKLQSEQRWHYESFQTEDSSVLIRLNQYRALSLLPPEIKQDVLMIVNSAEYFSKASFVTEEKRMALLKQMNELYDVLEKMGS